MSNYWMRAVAAVEALAPEHDEGVVPLEEVAAEMQRRWPAMFPRPLRMVGVLCRQAVDRGILAEWSLASANGHRPDWTAFGFALVD